MGFQSAPGFSAGRNNMRLACGPMQEKFQSAPGFSAGRNPAGSKSTTSFVVFQSAPGFSAGRNPDEHTLAPVTVRVSIRSRLFGREKPATSTALLWDLLFQSAPGFSAGRNHAVPPQRREILTFQSAPGFSAGRNSASATVGRQSEFVVCCANLPRQVCLRLG